MYVCNAGCGSQWLRWRRVELFPGDYKALNHKNCTALRLRCACLQRRHGRGAEAWMISRGVESPKPQKLYSSKITLCLLAAPAWPRWRSVEDFPRDRPLFVSFSNAHYSDLMLNWVKALRILDVRTRALARNSTP